MTIIGCTGHRELSHDPNLIKEHVRKILIENKCDLAITGMALGFDTLFAEVVIELGIPFVAAVPFAEQASVWPEKEKAYYLELLSKATEVYIHPETKIGNCIYAGYFGRNRWIVEKSEFLIAYMINSKDGGTAHTWKYAEKKGLKAINIVDLL